MTATACSLALPSRAEPRLQVTTVVNDAVSAASGGAAAPAASRCLPVLSRSEVLEALRWGRHPGGKTEPFWVLDPIDGTKVR